jgi:K+-sensing histidine kinase KdpD
MAAALIGAGVGIFLAWLLEITGHPSWSVLLMILCAIAPSIMIVLFQRGEPRSTSLAWIRWEISPWIKVIAALVLVVATLFVVHTLNINPRDHYYLPLLPPIILAAIFLGFGPALFAVVVSTVIADYVYAPPQYSFAITEWEDAAGLAARLTVFDDQLERCQERKRQQLKREQMQGKFLPIEHQPKQIPSQVMDCPGDGDKGGK